MNTDDKYRADGWGVVSEAVLGVTPSNTESQARCVAMATAELVAALQMCAEHSPDVWRGFVSTRLENALKDVGHAITLEKD